MIAAVASDLGIGKDGKLLFHIKEDMAWFRSHTLHNVVVMGRKTLESFPGGRPLPERTHIVLSHKKHENTENVIWVTSVEEALAKMEKLPGEVYVTGGEQVYREFLPLASKLYLTEVAEKCDADAYFPDFLSDGEWEKMEENKHFTKDWTNCRLCPRECGADRTRGFGACKVGNTITAARAALHMWEEPCISGEKGSGTVFFSGCNLHCVFCQNYEISSMNKGKEITVQRLREIYFELIAQGANNINLVTPTHFTHAILESLKEPLPVPVVYNTSGFETLDTLRKLKGKVQIWLPDLKYSDDLAAIKYSNAPSYFRIATDAIKEMYKQVGPYKLNDDGIMQSGVIIRHLLMPGMMENTKGVIDWVAKTFKPGEVMFSLMHQYVPCGRAADYPEINRRVTDEEYAEVEQYLFDSGIEDGFVQEDESACEDFIPKFDGTGV